MRRVLAGVGLLTALLFAIDRLYRVLHRVVDLERAALVGLTALAALIALARLPLPAAVRVRPLPGALAILVSAVLSVLLIESGTLVSRSLVSGLVHAAILAFAYPLLSSAFGDSERAPRAADQSVPTRLKKMPWWS